VTRVTPVIGTIQDSFRLHQVTEHHTRSTTRETAVRTLTMKLLRRANAYTLWAFNPQPELSSRYDRG
jgi:hypothetical protein